MSDAKRILITGATGVVGTALLQHLRTSGYEVVALLGQKHCNLEDASDTQDAFNDARPDCVIHLAAAVYGLGGNITFPGDIFRRNMLINTNVIDASRKCGARKIVAMGTTAIYSDRARQPFEESDALVDVPHGSEFAYAYAKRAMLVQLECYQRQFGLDFAYAISTNVYGPHDRFDPTYGHVVPSLMWKFANAEKSETAVEVWGDGSPTRDFIYASDVAQGLGIMLEHGSGAYNLATGKAHTIRELVSIISQHFPDIEYRWDTSKPLGQKCRSYDITRLSQLGFKSQHTLEMGIRETVQWIRTHWDSIRTA